MPAKRKHLSEEDRFIIEQGLRSGKSLLAIAREIGRPHSTVAREILRHRFASNKNPYRGRINTCKNRRGCIRRHLCADAANCNRLCRICGASCRPGGCDCYEGRNDTTGLTEIVILHAVKLGLTDFVIPRPPSLSFPV